jgi:hypothetical protein
MDQRIWPLDVPPDVPPDVHVWMVSLARTHEGRFGRCGPSLKLQAAQPMLSHQVKSIKGKQKVGMMRSQGG